MAGQISGCMVHMESDFMVYIQSNPLGAKKQTPKFICLQNFEKEFCSN